MITIKEMAKQLGVSPTTVSNVINGRTEKMSEQTKLRIEEMLAKYHYVQDSRGGRNSALNFWNLLPGNWKATEEA